MKKISALVLLFVFALAAFCVTGASAMKPVKNIKLTKKKRSKHKAKFMLTKPRASDYKF